MKHVIPNKSFFTKNRENFAKEMKPKSLALFLAATPKSTNADGLYKFKQDSNFFYLTGVEMPKSALILNPDAENDKNKEVLFIEKPNPQIEEWIGKRMTVEEAKEISGIDNVQFIDDFKQRLVYLLYNSENLYISYNPVGLDASLPPRLQLIQKIRERFPALNIIQANTQLIEQRLVKAPEEIDMLKKAIEITGKGLEAVWKTVKPGMHEFELQALLEKTYLVNRSEHIGFPAIIASGENACTLHYETNENQIEDNTLILIDTGTEYANYTSDITRTFPVNGKFTDRQKQVYQKVLDANKAIIDMVKPGITLKELNEKTRELLTESCKELGLEKENDSEFMVFIKHSVGHYLGLDAHDVGHSSSTELKAGNVITIEPGLYISDEKIGVRIEDDILVTEDGHENLSASIPKELEVLEQLMAK